MAPMDKSYTNSFKAEQKIQIESENSDPDDIFERKLWFQKVTSQSLQIKMLALLLGGVMIFESWIQLRSLKSGLAIGQNEKSEILGHKLDPLMNDWGLFTATRYS